MGVLHLRWHSLAMARRNASEAPWTSSQPRSGCPRSEKRSCASYWSAGVFWVCRPLNFLAVPQVVIATGQLQESPPALISLYISVIVVREKKSNRKELLEAVGALTALRPEQAQLLQPTMAMAAKPTAKQRLEQACLAHCNMHFVSLSVPKFCIFAD